MPESFIGALGFKPLVTACEMTYGDPVAEVDTQGLGNPPAARVEDET